MIDEPSDLPAGEEPIEPAHDEIEIDGAANILEQLLLDDGFPIDRGLLRRVVRETAAAFPGEASQVWWRWIGEAGKNLGLKCKVVDCTLSELRELARDGARLIMFVSGPNPWRAVTGIRKRAAKPCPQCCSMTSRRTRGKQPTSRQRNRIASPK